MYRVLIVDDDINICMGMRRLIDWEELGFTICDSAINGRDAFELCKKTPYDLIVTDIKMPVMDGLEMISCIRELGIGSEIIIISAYGEFSYAQKAMAYGVKYYLVKPIEEMVLEGYLSRIRELLDANEKSENGIDCDQIERQYRMSSNGVIPEIKNYILRHFSEPISVNMLADMYNFSPVYLGRVFKNHVGQSVNEFVRSIRIRAACDALKRDADISIHDLAESVGFNDLNYFYKQFKSETGLTPNQYRSGTESKS